MVAAAWEEGSECQLRVQTWREWPEHAGSGVQLGRYQDTHRYGHPGHHTNVSPHGLGLNEPVDISNPMWSSNGVWTRKRREDGCFESWR